MKKQKINIKPHSFKDLNIKQKAFALEYLKDGNATRSYKTIYKTKSDGVASVNGIRLLGNAKLAEFIAKEQEKLIKKKEITLEMVLEGYKRLAFYDSRKFYEKDGTLKKIPTLDDETAFALSGMEVIETVVRGKKIAETKKIKTTDRRAALDSICNVLGYNKPTKIEGDMNITWKEEKIYEAEPKTDKNG